MSYMVTQVLMELMQGKLVNISMYVMYINSSINGAQVLMELKY